MYRMHKLEVKNTTYCEKKRKKHKILYFAIDKEAVILYTVTAANSTKLK